MPEDEKPPEGDKGGEADKQWTAEDVKKVQNTLNKQADGLRNELAAEREARSKSEGRLADLEGRLETMQAEVEEDPDPAAVKALRGEVLKQKRLAQQFQQRGWELAVKGAATDVAMEYGLSIEERDELARKLDTAADSESGLRLAVDREKLDRERAQLQEERQKAEKEGPPEVDTGRPTAGQRSLINDMEATSLEDWAKKREEFEKRILKR